VATKARWGVATALEASGDLEHAIVEYEQLRELQANGDQHRSSLAAATALCRCYREVGDLAHAIAVGDGAVAQLRRYGLSGSDAHINLLLTIAMAYLERGDLTKTRQLLVEVQQYVDALGTPRARGAAYWNAAVLAGELGDTAESVQFIERATALFGEGDDERNLARLRGTYATLLMRHDPNRATDAALTLQRAREKLERIGSQVDVAYCETELSRAYTLTHRIDEAVTTARAALSRLDHGMRLESARARTALAYALAASGDAMAARTEYLSAATTLEAMGARRQATLVWLELAEMERVQGDVDQALNAMSRAISTAAFRVPFPAPVRVAPKAPATGDRG
jgi:tetratricopeptide (TPR) repeat protein